MKNQIGFAVILMAATVAPACAQTPEPARPAAVALPAPAAQVSAAVAPLPEEFRANAAVLGYRSAGGPLEELRAGSGAYICLADAPGDDRFHVACYHRTLEPFMARGRALRAAKVENVDSVRYAEIDSGKLKMPAQPAALYSLTGKPEAFDAATGAITGARPLYVVYLPFATPESTGIPATPGENTPWLMFPGTPKAHIMFVPRMQ